MRQPSIGVIGAGVIGRTHAEVIARSDECRLAGIADPTEAGRAFGERLGVPTYADHAALIAARPDAIIVATPNATHRPIALDSISAGIPVLVEKPIAETVADGLAIAAASAWSWDLASGENPNYPPPPAPVQTHFLCGTHGSLSLPTLEHWCYDDVRSWFEPIRRQAVCVAPESPYVLQLRHFCRVAQGREAPLIDAADATRTLAATLAVKAAARLGHGVAPETVRC